MSPIRLIVFILIVSNSSLLSAAETSPSLTQEMAAELITEYSGNKVISTSIDKNNAAIYRIKTLSNKGHVKVYRVDSISGKIQK